MNAERRDVQAFSSNGNVRNIARQEESRSLSSDFRVKHLVVEDYLVVVQNGGLKTFKTPQQHYSKQAGSQTDAFTDSGQSQGLPTHSLNSRSDTA